MNTGVQGDKAGGKPPVLESFGVLHAASGGDGSSQQLVRGAQSTGSAHSVQFWHPPCQPLQCQPLGAASRAAGAARGGLSWDFLRQGREKRIFPYSPKSIRIQMCPWLKYPSSDTKAFQLWPTEINVPGFPGVRPQLRAGFCAVRIYPPATPFPLLISSEKKDLRQAGFG